MPTKYIKAKHATIDEKTNENLDPLEKCVSNHYEATFPKIFLYLFHVLE